MSLNGGEFPEFDADATAPVTAAILNPYPLELESRSTLELLTEAEIEAAIQGAIYCPLCGEYRHRKGGRC
jgi:hypothetical protein